MVVLLILVPLLFATLLIYYYWSRRHLYAAVSKMNGPPGLPIIGNGLLFMGKTEDILYKINVVLKGFDDEPVKFWLGPALLIVLRNPVHLEKIMSSQKFSYKHELYAFLENFLGDGLISASGVKQKYKTHRRLIQPLFDLKFIESSLKTMQRQIDICIKRLDNYVDEEEFNIHDFIMTCSIDMFAEIILGKPIDSQTRGYNKFCRALEDMYDNGISRLVKFWLHPDFIFNMLPIKKEFDRIVNDIHEFGQEAILDSRKRRKLLHDNKREFVPIIDKLTDIAENNPNDMNSEDLLNHLVTLFAASDDTFGLIGSFTAVCFGMYPEYQNKAVAELKSVLGEKSKSISLEDIYKMNYLDMCIKDVLRLFPIGAYLLRRNLEDYKLDKWIIPKGAAIVIPVFNLHRDRKHWENPEHFHPDHFLTETVQKRHIYAYLPFSAGPRGCIGKTLANIGLKLFMANFLKNFEIVAKGQVPDIELKTDISVRPKQGFYCNIRRRIW